MKRRDSLLVLWFSSFSLLALVGCTGLDGPPTPLAAFSDTTLKINLQDDQSPLTGSEDEVPFSVSFEYDRTKGCRRLPSGTKATLDGQEAVLGRGETVYLLEGDPGCFAPFVYLKLKRSSLQGQDGRLVITDGETTFTVVVTALLAPHHWIPNESLASVRPRQELSFKWSVPTDVVEYGSAIFNAELLGDGNKSIDHADVADGTLSVGLHPDAARGPQVLVTTGQTKTPVARCDGPAACEAIVASGRALPITVE